MKEKTTTQKFKVGQKLYKQISTYGELPVIQELTIERIGRKYLYATGELDYSIDKLTLYSNRHEKLYVDGEELNERLNKEYLWGKIVNMLHSYSYPKNLTLEQIRTAALALGAVKEEDVKEL